MNVIKSFYRLFTIIVSYQCCLGTPPNNYEITLPTAHVMGVNKTFTGVKLRKGYSTANSCRFDVIFRQSEHECGYFTPADAEITFMYEKRLIAWTRGQDTSTVYGFNFESDAALQLFFSSLRYYQPKPESYVPLFSMLKYSREAPADLEVMTQGCELHIQDGIKWKSLNLTRLRDDGTREGILTFMEKTFSVSRAMGNTKFSLCHNDLLETVFILCFPNPSSGARFINLFRSLEYHEGKDLCDFPNLSAAQKKIISKIHKKGPGTD